MSRIINLFNPYVSDYEYKPIVVRKKTYGKEGTTGARSGTAVSGARSGTIAGDGARSGTHTYVFFGADITEKTKKEMEKVSKKDTTGNALKRLLGGARGAEVSMKDIFGNIDIQEQKDTYKKTSAWTPIFEYVYEDDTVSDLKKKIQYHTGIPTVCQYIFSLDTDTGEYITLDHEYTYADRLNRSYKDIEAFLPSGRNDTLPGRQEGRVAEGDARNRDTLSSKKGKATVISPLDFVDTKFIQKYNDKKIFLKDKRKYILTGYTEIFLYDFRDFLSLFDHHTFEKDIKDNEANMSLYYDGFIKKFFPFMDRLQFREVFSGNDLKTADFFHNISFINVQQDQVSFIRSLKSDLLLKQKEFTPGKTSYLSTNIRINFQIPPHTVFFDLRILFDQFILDENVPFAKMITYDATQRQIVVQKTFAGASAPTAGASAPDQTQVYEWKKNKPKNRAIVFRMREEKDTQTKRFVLVTIYENGRTVLSVSWNDGENVDFEGKSLALFKAFDHYMVNKINSMEKNVFRGIKKHFYYSPSDVTFDYFHVIFPLIFNTNVEKIDFSVLREFFNVFIAFTKTPKEIIEEQQRKKNGLVILYSRINQDIQIKEETMVLAEELNRMEATELSVEEEFPEEQRYIRVEMTGEWNTKVLIKGLRKFCDLNYIYNFVLRIFYLYFHFADLVAHRYPNIELLAGPLQKKITIPKRRGSLSSSSSHAMTTTTKKETLGIRNLQSVDADLFNYHKKLHGTDKEKYVPYSRNCQKGKQPIAFLSKTDAQESVADGTDGTRGVGTYGAYAMEYENKTRPGEMVYYVCTEKNYPYPGFLDNAKHPKGFCLPCCKKISSIENKRSPGYKKYIDCVGKVLEEQYDQEKDVQDQATIISNPLYIKEYTYNKILDTGRYGMLPKYLAMLFNNTASKEIVCNFIATNILHQGSKCYFLYGIPMPQRLFTAMIYLYPTHDATTEQEALNELITFALNKGDKLLNVLAEGYARFLYSDIKTLVKALKSYECDQNVLIDLVSLFLNINIILFKDIDGHVSLELTTQKESIQRALIQPKKKTGVILKTVVSSFIGANKVVYRPICHLTVPPTKSATSTASAKSAKSAKSTASTDDISASIRETFLFDINTPIVSSIFSLIEFTSLHTSPSSSSSIQKSSLVSHVNLETLLRHLPQGFITQQYIHPSDYLVSEVTIKDTFSFPVSKSLPAKDIPIVRKRKYGHVNKILSFFFPYSSSLFKALSIVPKTVVIFLPSHTIVALVLNTNFLIRTAPAPHAAVRNLTPLYITYKIEDSEEYSKTMQKIEPSLDKEIVTLRNFHERYNLLVLELSYFLQNEINEPFIAKIYKEVQSSERLKTHDLRKTIRKKLKAYIEEYYEDIDVGEEYVSSDYGQLKDALYVYARRAREGVSGSVHSTRGAEGTSSPSRKELLTSILENREYFDFNFNKNTKNTLQSLLNTYDSNGDLSIKADVHKILKGIINNIVYIMSSSSLQSSSVENIRKICTSYETKNACEAVQGTVSNQCSWKSQCLMNISKADLDIHINRITEEMMQNYTKRHMILSGITQSLLFGDKFTERDTEVLERSVL